MSIGQNKLKTAYLHRPKPTLHSLASHCHRNVASAYLFQCCSLHPCHACKRNIAEIKKITCKLDCPVLHSQMRFNYLPTYLCHYIHFSQCNTFYLKKGEISKNIYSFMYYLIATINNSLSGPSMDILGYSQLYLAFLPAKVLQHKMTAKNIEQSCYFLIFCPEVHFKAKNHHGHCSLAYIDGTVLSSPHSDPLSFLPAHIKDVVNFLNTREKL